jgi:hypothetical protein
MRIWDLNLHSMRLPAQLYLVVLTVHQYDRVVHGQTGAAGLHG